MSIIKKKGHICDNPSLQESRLLKLGYSTILCSECERIEALKEGIKKYGYRSIEIALNTILANIRKDKCNVNSLRETIVKKDLAKMKTLTYQSEKKNMTPSHAVIGPVCQ